MTVIQGGIYIGAMAASGTGGYKVKPAVEKELRNDFPNLNSCIRCVFAHVLTMGAGAAIGGAVKGSYTGTWEGAQVGLALGGSTALAGGLFSEKTRLCNAIGLAVLIVGLWPKE